MRQTEDCKVALEFLLIS